MNYHSLDKHFIAPKNMSFNCKRVPRKFKKKWKHILNTYDFLTLNQKLWYIQGLTNPNYNRFLIKKIITMSEDKLSKEVIPYKEALELKELKFDEPCFAYYGEINGGEIELFLKKEFNSETPFVLAPTFSQAFRWFRKKGYDVKIQKESDGLYFGFYWTGAAWVIFGVGTYEEAELECVKKLIEIVKSEKNKSIT